MGDHQRRRRRRRRRPRGVSGEDWISGLPDELLHDILIRAGSAQDAARTSVLSRRWRHVWAYLPELHFISPPAVARAKFMDSVDAALAGYLAPTLEHLRIIAQLRDDSNTAGRVAPWLQFAAEHIVGSIHLCVSPIRGGAHGAPDVIDDEAVLELPACEGAKQIVLSITEEWRVRPQAAGQFTALTSLRITNARMGGAELTALVCTQCPRLRDLHLSLELMADLDVSVHSKSLHSLWFVVRNTRRLEVMAPKLEKLTVHDPPVEAQISASKLDMVAWNGAYNPHLHRTHISIGLLMLAIPSGY